MKISLSVASLVMFVLTLPRLGAGAANDSGIAGEVREYLSVGRIQWTLPKKTDFYWAVPHFTAGARLKCTGGKEMVPATAPPASPEPGDKKEPIGSADCEIGVYPRDLRMDAEQRKKEFFDNMRPLLKNAVENSLEIKSYGGGDPVYYATLTDKRANQQWRYATMGLYVKGSFAVKFHHLTNDTAELNKVLQLVYSAEPLDTLAVFAWKLSDYQSVCDKRFPELKQTNDAAFSSSKFASVDWLKLWHARDTSVPIEKLAAGFAEARDDLSKEFSARPVAEWEAFCKSYPRQVKEAERAM